MKLTACCKSLLYESLRQSEDKYPYGELRRVLCCKGCGTEWPRMVEVRE